MSHSVISSTGGATERPATITPAARRGPRRTGSWCIVALVWSIHNRTPYGGASTWGRTKEGIHEWLVAVRATFDIGPGGRLTLAEDQPEPLLLPEYRGEAGTSSLQYEAEVVSPKPTTDVLVNGTAYA